jgi:hypothetical protein
MTEPLISSERVSEMFHDVLYTNEELEAGQAEGDRIAPDDAVIVQGVLMQFGMHPGRLESHRDEIRTMLSNLPTQFRDQEHGGDGGWSFLNACQDANDEQWTGMHQVMDELFVMGIGLGLASYLLPREMWDAMPGGMPYLVVRA